MPPLRNKVQPGERRILADEYNAFLAMAKRPGDGLASDGFSDFYQASRAYIKNTTAAKVEAFGVLGIDSPVITRATNNPEFFGAPTFNGVTPDIDLHAGKFAILQEPAMPGDTVRAVVAGGTWAWLNVVAEADTTAEIADGVRAYVETGTSGTAKIIWKEAGTGIKAGFIALNVGAPPTGIPFRNDSGETVPAYGVMRVTGSVTVSGTEYVTIGKPNSDFKRKYLVNTGSSVGTTDATKYGTGTWLDEGGWVLYDDANTPAIGESWGPSNGSWELKKWRYGFSIIGNPTGGSTDLVRAWQEEVNEFVGKTDSTHNKNSTGTVSIYDGNLADTTDNMSSVENKFANVSSSKWVQVRWNAGKWHLVAAEC